MINHKGVQNFVASLVMFAKSVFIHQDTGLDDPGEGLTAIRFASDGGVHVRPYGGSESELATVAAVANIGLDDLSNVLVVDAGFDSATPGWGTIAFATVSTALSQAASGDVVLCFGAVSWGYDVVSVGVGVMLHLVDATVTNSGDPMIIAGGTVSGTGTFHVDSFAELTIQDDATVTGNISAIHPSASVSVQLAGANCYISGLRVVGDINNSINVGSTTFVNLNIDGVLFTQTAYLASASFYNCNMDSSPNIYIDPLNHTNTIGGSTYREVVAVADLPAASSANAGATAATSDGSADGSPALMYSDGTSWRDATINLEPNVRSVAADYTLVAADSGAIIECTGTLTLTLPDGLDIQCAIINVGAGVVTFAATTIQSKNGAVTLADQYGAASAYYRGSNTWLVAGDLA